MGNLAEPFEESLVAGLRVDVIDEAAIHFQVMQAEIMQYADPAEFSPEVLDADMAVETHHVHAERAEGIQMRKRAGL